MENKKNIIFNVIWSLLGQFAFMFIMFFANILLAKKLSPIEFGQIGIVMFFVNLFNVLIESGLGGALIRKENVKKIDYSTVFVFNLMISIILYFILFISSPYIANFYNDSTLTQILQFTGIILLINAFQITQNTKLIKELQFKKLTLYRIISVVISSIIGIFLAYITNIGVWSIVIMQVLNVFINTILLNIDLGRINEMKFSKDSFLSLYKFGVNTTLASILNTIFENIYNLVLGKYFSVASTGYYYQAKKIQDVPVNIINTLNHGVIFSTLSKAQSNTSSFFELYKMIFKYLIFVIGFVSLGMYLFSETIILTVLGEKWNESALFMQYLSAFSFFFLLEQYNRVIFKVFNQTHRILQLEVIKKTIQFISIIIGVYLSSLEILMQGFVIISIISYAINYYTIKKEFEFVDGYEIIQLFKILLIVSVLIIVFKYIKFTEPLKMVLYVVLYLIMGFLLKFISLVELKKIKL